MTHLITSPDIPTRKIDEKMQAMTIGTNQIRHHPANSKWASPISGILNEEERRLEKEKLEKGKSLEQRRGHLSAILEAEKNKFEGEISSQRRPSGGLIPQMRTPADSHLQPTEVLKLASLPYDDWPRQQQEEEPLQYTQEQDRQANSKRRNQQLKIILQQQMDEFNHAEQEAEALQQEEERLIRAQWELEQFQEQRRQMKKDYRQQDNNRQLLRQHKAKLYKRSKEILEHLDVNIQFLASFAYPSAETRLDQSSEQEQFQQNALNLLEQFQQQLQTEQAKARDLDGMYQEDAAKQCARFEQEWNRDQEAREKLMRPVITDRQEQLMKQLRALKDQQRDVFDKQRTLIEEMEQARTYDRSEKQKHTEENKQVPMVRQELERRPLPDPIDYQPTQITDELLHEHSRRPPTDAKFFGRRRIHWN